MEIVQDKLKISIAYTLKERTGKILEEVPANVPFVYIHGYNNIIPGLEDALNGRHLNESFSVDIPFEQGYGPYRPDLVMEVPKEELREVGEIWLGMELEMFMDDDVREFQLPETPDEFVDGLNLDDDGESDGIYTIKEIKKETVIFDVTVVAIEQPSFTELESGFPEGEENFDNGFDDFDEDDFDSNNPNRRWR